MPGRRPRSAASETSPTGGSSGERSESTTAEPSITESASSSASAGAPADLSESDISSALSTEIGGYQLIALTPSEMQASGSDFEEEISSSLDLGVEVAPASCEDPFMDFFLGGVLDAEDSVLAIDADGDLVLTVRTFYNPEAAQEAFQEQRDALEGCRTVELTSDGSTGEAEVGVENITVDGASSAYEASVSGQGTLEVVNPSMAYGNTIVLMASMDQYAGGPAPDNEALLGEVAQALSAP